MIFKQLSDPATGNLSYLLGDPIGLEGVLVDPVYERSGEYLRLLGHFGLRLRYSVETRLQDNRISASPLMREETGARIAVHDAADHGCADLRLRHGDLLHFGEETLRVLHVAGISPCAVALHWRDRLFTGEALLVGRLGCPAPHGGDPRALCANVRERLLGLAGETLVFPGREWSGRRISTLDQEIATNPDLLVGDSCGEAVAAHCCEEPLASGEADLLVINGRCAARHTKSDGLTGPTDPEGEPDA